MKTIKDKKAILEHKILSLIREFEGDHGVTVACIRSDAERARLGGRPETIHVSLDVML